MRRTLLPALLLLAACRDRDAEHARYVEARRTLADVAFRTEDDRCLEEPACTRAEALLRELPHDADDREEADALLDRLAAARARRPPPPPPAVPPPPIVIVRDGPPRDRDDRAGSVLVPREDEPPPPAPEPPEWDVSVLEDVWVPPEERPPEAAAQAGGPAGGEARPCAEVQAELQRVLADRLARATAGGDDGPLAGLAQLAGAAADPELQRLQAALATCK